MRIIADANLSRVPVLAGSCVVVAGAHWPVPAFIAARRAALRSPRTLRRAARALAWLRARLSDVELGGAA